MQRFVALSSCQQNSLSLSTSFQALNSHWTSTRDGCTPPIRSGSTKATSRNNISNFNDVRRLSLVRSEKLSKLCCRCSQPNGYGREERPHLGGKTLNQTVLSTGGALRGPEARPFRQRQVVEAFREYGSRSMWTHGDGNEYEDENPADDYEGGGIGSSLSPELWKSRFLMQLSLFWNSLGYSSLQVDEWLVSHEERRRLDSVNNSSSEFSPAEIAPPTSSSILSFNPLSALASLDMTQSVASVSPGGCPVRERVSWWSWFLDCLPLYRWLSRMSDTYGKSFMALVALGYATQGFRCFPWFAVGYMLKDGLQVDPAYMQFLLSSAAIPMVLKPIYGIMSDTVYIRGAHRVPYLAIAGILQLMAWGALAFSQKATSSAILLTAALTFGNLGAAIADVMNDALVAEVSKKNKGSGELQSFAWLIMASGGLIGNLLGGFALKSFQDLTTMYVIFLGLLGLHFFVCLLVSERNFGLAPSVVHSTAVIDVRKWQKKTQRLADATSAKVKLEAESMAKKLPGLWSQLGSQIGLLSQLLKKKDVSRTLLWFCASYAMVPVLGSSIFYYQTQVLKIDPTFIGFSRMVGQLSLIVGSQLYSGVLKDLPMRRLLGSVQFLLSLCMLSDLVLVKRLNLQLGIPDEIYVLGASALVDCIAQFKVLPVIVKLGHLCPPGTEGSLMAFFSSCHCLAGLCSGYFGVALANHLQISSLNFEGLPVGIFIQAMFALLPILAINLIPADVSTKPTKVPEKIP